MIGSDGGTGQNLEYYLNPDRDDDSSGETALLETNLIDDDWGTGYVGLFRANSDTSTHTFDNFKVGYDNNANGDIADSGDDIQIDDNFDSAALTLAHDDNSNLTDDGVFCTSRTSRRRCASHPSNPPIAVGTVSPSFRA